MPKRPAPPLPQRVVGIGASAGGLEALKQLVSNVSERSGLAFVILQHLPPSQTGALASLLSACTRMPVIDCAGTTRVMPDTILVVPPRATAALSRGSLVVRAGTPGVRPRRPIDGLFESLAKALGSRAIGVVLSGTGDDGTEGLRAIQTAGGLTFAQDPSSAQFDGMPESAISANVAEIVVDAEAIGRELSALAVLIPAVPKRGTASEEEAAIERILVAVRERVGVDFSSYKRTTIERRISRRVVARQLRSVVEYAALLDAEPEETSALYDDLLIHVTEFFRDRAVLDTLVRRVLGRIVHDKPDGIPVRVWIPGCSTGEEVYSIAILLLELLGDRADRIQLFGSDLSARSIDVARKGSYAASIAGRVGPERLAHYFHAHEGGYRINKIIRDRCVFVHHDVLADPPFSRLDLISCRNVLIYLGPELQRRLIPVFHYALEQPGYLLLGRAETVAGFEKLFSPVDNEARIYARKPGKGALPLSGLLSAARYPRTARGSAAGPNPDIEREVDHALLARYAPACVVVDENLEVLRFRGRTSPYLEQPPGEPQRNLLRLAREGLAAELPIAVRRAHASERAVTSAVVVLHSEHGERQVRLEVLPMRTQPGSKHLYIVVFEELPQPIEAAARAPGKPKRAPRGGSELARVRRELAETKEYLHSLATQHLATSEELGITNEELQSTNEELQSSNEELQTAKEELQSTNEELETVNDALRSGNEQLHVLNDDLINVLASVEFAIVIVDAERLIRRFTPRAQLVMKLRDADVGRPIADLQAHIQVPDLDAVITHVIDTLATVEKETRHADGTWYRMQIRPYRTPEHQVRGAVLTLVDITTLRTAREQASNIVETVPMPLVVVDAALNVISTNRAFRQEFERDLASAAGPALFDIGSWDPEEPRSVLAAGIRDAVSTGSLRVQHRGSRGVRMLEIVANPMPIREMPRQVLVALNDVTAEVELAHLNESERRQRDSFLNAVSHELRTPLAAIRLWAEALRDLPEQAPIRAHAIQTILDSATAEAELVDDLIELAGSNAPSLSIGIENVDIAGAVDKAVASARDAALAKHISLSLAVEPGTHALADPRRIRQIIAALLSNAIKFTPEGGNVAISSSREPPCVVVRVSDSGPGIPPELASRIFDPFWQADRSNTRAHQGLGIGLALVRHLAQQQGGSIAFVANTPAPGSTFVVRLPAAGA